MPAYLSRYAQNHTLAPGVALDIDIPVDGARDWCFILKNTGSTNAVTAMTVARYPLGTAEIGEDPASVSTGIPLAAGDALPVEGAGEPVTALRVTLTSTSGTTVRLAGGGW